MQFGRPSITAAVLLSGWVALAPTPSHANFKPPPTMEEPKAHPNVWFGQRKDGRWCAFAWTRKGASFLGGFETGWARYEKGRLTSITSISSSEDAYSRDQYFLDSEKKITKMVRTGHYIEDPWASFTYTPDVHGKLRLTPEAKALAGTMKKAGQDPYIIDWPTYSSASEMPFSELLDWNPGPKIRLGCAKYPKPIKQ